jgi:proteasome lid subunit RPN8/RPN11
MLQLTAAVRAAMVAHALRGLPHEACGLFSGPPGDPVATDFHPMTNIAASSELYQLDGVEMMGVERSVLDMIGNTPIVDVSALSPNPDVRILAKMEGQNPAGSVKDRIALAMIERPRPTARSRRARRSSSRRRATPASPWR